MRRALHCAGHVCFDAQAMCEELLLLMHEMVGAAMQGMKLEGRNCVNLTRTELSAVRGINAHTQMPELRSCQQI